MGIFSGFDWDKSIRDKGNNKKTFKTLNIIYGRNYSGKTTLSRIIRSLETGVTPKNYKNIDFEIQNQDNSVTTQNHINNYPYDVRVFNEDFIKDNLSFIYNNEQEIKSFAILGDKNLELEQKISELESKLNATETDAGLINQEIAINSTVTGLKIQKGKINDEIENKLKDVANNDIKRNTSFNEITYNISKLKTDLAVIKSKQFESLSDDLITEYTLLLKEEAKSKGTEYSSLNIDMVSLEEECKELCERQIKISKPIASLIENSLLESWVRSGLQHHQDKDTCGFCGQTLPQKLLTDLNEHFNTESEQLRSDLENKINSIKKSIENIDSLINIDQRMFYDSQKKDVTSLQSDIKSLKSDLKSIYSNYKKQLENRINKISHPLSFNICNKDKIDQDGVILKINNLIKDANDITDNLYKKQNAARINLKLNTIKNILDKFNYKDKQTKMEELDTEIKTKSSSLFDVRSEIKSINDSIDSLKSQLQDERKGAERINLYLSNFFGHKSISLKPIAKTDDNSFKFEIYRDTEKAFNLSEGECSLVAFCYFIAKLDDIHTKDHMPIIWIDDPISSLDLNHIFFVFSLINNIIIKTQNFSQFFISTHNLDFLKYTKRFDFKKSSTDYYILHRTENNSTISPMPNYMSEYVSEFNYLFHKLYKCSQIDPTHLTDQICDEFYNFGNNARKFLEIFLAFKYPNPNEKEDIKLEKFIGSTDNPIASSLLQRVNNEFSHLYGAFERGMKPIDIPEMQLVASFILQKVNEHDPAQYDSLILSIQP